MRRHPGYCVPGTRAVLFAAAVCFAVASTADVYRWVDKDGNVIFSDTPQPGAEKIELKETTIVPAEKIVRPTTRLSPGKSEKKAFDGYTSLRISAPANEETVRNERSVTVTVDMEPGLSAKAGHMLQLYFDGAPYGPPGPATSFTIDGLERGEHQLSAAVLGSDGAILKRSETSVFYVHLHSIQN